MAGVFRRCSLTIIRVLNETRPQINYCMDIVANNEYNLQDKAINIRFFYDIACVLDTHSRERFFGSFI